MRSVQEARKGLENVASKDCFRNKWLPMAAWEDIIQQKTGIKFSPSIVSRAFNYIISREDSKFTGVDGKRYKIFNNYKKIDIGSGPSLKQIVHFFWIQAADKESKPQCPSDAMFWEVKYKQWSKCFTPRTTPKRGMSTPQQTKQPQEVGNHAIIVSNRTKKAQYENVDLQ